MLKKLQPDQWRWIEQSKKLIVGTVLAIIFTRAFTALLTPGYSYDQNAFTLWGMRMAQTPASEFYAEGYFADYPPGYLWVLKLVGIAMLHWNIPLGSALAGLLLALPVVLGEAVLGAVLVYTAYSRHGEKAGKFWAWVAVLNPSLWFNTGVWKQVDALFGMLLMVCFLLLAEKEYIWGAFFYGMALSMKPQALILGPVLAVAFLLPCLNPATRWRQCKRIGLGALVSVAVVWLPAIPFWGPIQALPKLVEKYIETSGGYPYASINAAGLMAALGANWHSWDEKFLLFSWKTWGTLFILLVTVWMIWLAWKSWKQGGFCPLLLAGVYAIGVFSLGHAMHERYVVFGAVLILAAAAKWQDKWLFWYGMGFTATSFANQVLVYSVLDTPYQFLNEGFAELFLQLIGAVTVVLFVLLAKRAMVLMQHEQAPVWFSFEKKPAKEKKSKNAKPVFALEKWSSKANSQPKFTPKEIGLLLGATVLLGVFSFSYLGETTAPQTLLDSQQGKQTTFTAKVEQTPQTLWVYPGISYGGRLTITDQSGTTVLDKELSYATCFQWSSIVLHQASSEYTITLENAQLIELAFKDEKGQVLQVESDQSLVFDEGNFVPETISQLNSMYFDEIYHGRTGFEFLHQLPVYETTHPPLGKDLIALGVAIFGMTGFGWRFFGTLCGVAMMPVIYLLVRRVSKSRSIAAFAAALISLDFMRYSQSRIATIDSYVVLFILLSALFMVWYCQSVLEKGVENSLLPMALCGIAFGLGVAAKWTGLYAGAGLAVIYFVVLYLRYLQKPQNFGREFGFAIGGGVVFFVLIPFAIYIASYLPYFIREPDFGLEKWWQCQVTMFQYHSTLQSSHPYESTWFTWPFDYRPVWYYYKEENGMYSSISGMVNPVVCWLSTAAVGYTIVQVVRKKATRGQILLLAFYVAQLLPWVLVSRCTFLYHYFPSLVFAIGLLALAVQQLTQKKPKARKMLCGAILAAAAILLVWFFPALSGLPVAKGWAASMKWFSSWLLYPI